MSAKNCKWVRQFKEGWEDVQDCLCLGRPSVIDGDIVNVVDNVIPGTRQFNIFTLAVYFPHVSRRVLYKTVIGKTWVSHLTPDLKQQSLEW
ncbi:hypothetical protein PR048_012363 [Dryococelus australis]|uniref:Uncharacterized protein n=1 Tax=Dryococelus australis TaxID=614101 RepID=A0ABQ9HP49_9NEOP|nr:hypothetical protein PR048_012363 [Dryococelus australis]